jgi:hypothetical protein
MEVLMIAYSKALLLLVERLENAPTAVSKALLGCCFEGADVLPLVRDLDDAARDAKMTVPELVEQLGEAKTRNLIDSFAVDTSRRVVEIKLRQQ